MIEMIDKQGMLTLKEAAEYKGCSVTTIYNRLRAQRLPDRRSTHGTLLFTTEELDPITIAPPKTGSRVADEDEPVDIVNTQSCSAADPLAVRDEVLLDSRVLGTIGNGVSGFKRVRQFEEVPPTIRVWDLEVETTQGTEKWQAIYDLSDVRIQRID